MTTTEKKTFGQFLFLTNSHDLVLVFLKTNSNLLVREKKETMPSHNDIGFYHFSRNDNGRSFLRLDFIVHIIFKIEIEILQQKWVDGAKEPFHPFNRATSHF